MSTLTGNGTRLFGALNERFDIVTFDPCGTGASMPAIDCAVDQEAAGPFAQPFLTPVRGDPRDLVRRGDAYVHRCARRNADVLPYVSTANVARDMDLLRQAVGDPRLSYLGMSSDRYANDPIAETEALSAALERALGRFLRACAADQDACSGFGGDDPRRALDALVGRLDREPLAVGERSLDGDDVRVALGQGCTACSTGGRPPRRCGPPRTATESRCGSSPTASVRGPVTVATGPSSTSSSPSARWTSRTRAGCAPTALVIGTTYDPAAPYPDALALTRELGNARLLTMVGDGHGAYGGESTCVDGAVNDYLEGGVLPPAGKRCRQHVPF